MPYSKILVPYDESTQSKKALDHAIDLATMSQRHATIFILNVVEDNVLPPALEKVPELHHSKTLLEAKELLEGLLLKVRSEALKAVEAGAGEDALKRIEIRTSVVLGYPAEEIIDLAKRERVDLIVMGNVGLRGLSKVKVIGSVSRSVSESAPCPVLIVH